MIIYGSLTPKTLTEASLFWMEWDNTREILRRVLYRGSYLLQILLKALLPSLFNQWTTKTNEASWKGTPKLKCNHGNFTTVRRRLVVRLRSPTPTGDYRFVPNLAADLEKQMKESLLTYRSICIPKDLLSVKEDHCRQYLAIVRQ